MKQTNSLIKSAAFAAVMAVASTGAMAAAADTDKALSFDLTLTTDTFFGFAPMVAASYEYSDKVDFTAYAIYWSGGSVGQAFANWTEVGAGVNYAVTDSLSINPQLGFLGGDLISSAGAGEGIIGDGIVPNVTINYDSADWEGQVYFGAYLGLRDVVAGTTTEYMHYWANFGRKLNQNVSVGLHYEQLTGGFGSIDSAIYTWVGPYVQLTEPSTGTFLRVATGVDIGDANNALNPGTDSFYKVSFGVSF